MATKRSLEEKAQKFVAEVLTPGTKARELYLKYRNKSRRKHGPLMKNIRAAQILSADDYNWRANTRV